MRVTHFLAINLALAMAAFPVLAQVSEQTLKSISTPGKVDTRIGPLFFKDGAPSKATLDKVYDNLDFAHAFEAFVNTMQGVNAQAIYKGFADIGVKDNEILIFSTLMDAKSLFLTANADTVYFVGGLDLSKGPMILETPPKALGTLDDAWWRWIIDFGAPRPMCVMSIGRTTNRVLSG